jgi:hypothetical protein
MIIKFIAEFMICMFAVFINDANKLNTQKCIMMVENILPHSLTELSPS